MAELHVVFLQGMPSPFFSRIAKELSAMGCKATGINLCAGDALFWKGNNRIHFRGKHADWPAFIAEFLRKEHVTDMVLLGEQREYHLQAIEVAKLQGVRVIVTDFGYLRPDWITLERDGMNRNSRFPREPEAITQLASLVPKADLTQKYKDSTVKMAIGDLLYSFSNVFLWWLYPHYRRSDKRPHPFIYFPSVGWQLLMAKAGRKKAYAKMDALLKSKARYFLFPLQLDHDFQIVAYSPFHNMQGAIEKVMKSFALYSDKDVRLVIKVHPWDPGLKNWKKIIHRLAGIYAIRERVDYYRGGDLDAMISGSLGMVTVNSTAAIRALQLGSPVITLGDAIYNVPGLTHYKELDDYWKNAHPPDAKLTEDFINALAGTIQIRGVFFNEPGLSDAVRDAVERIYNRTVGTITY